MYDFRHEDFMGENEEKTPTGGNGFNECKYLCIRYTCVNSKVRRGNL